MSDETQNQADEFVVEIDQDGTVVEGSNGDGPTSVEMKPGDEVQPELIDVPPAWKDAWQGMPEYEHRDMMPWQTVLVHFTSHRDRRAFAELIGQPLHAKTKFVWYPAQEIRYAADKRWQSTGAVDPRYPVYVPTKGRWETPQTIRALERIDVPYYAVVQPGEVKRYESVVTKGKILPLPDGLDGLVPTRNWIRQHSMDMGFRRHWQIDDNIKAFARYHNNLKVDVTDGAMFRAMEDFSDRYKNVAVAGPNYYMFAPTRMGASIPPITMNTRVYSCSLVNNEMPHWWRDIYNDDTDLCLRALKDGWCVLLFNAFLCFKTVTMKLKGGNTGIYLGDGRKLMAESLQRQHPDVTTVIWKWGRWQHQVDYRRFRDNKLIPRDDVEVPEHPDNFGMELVPWNQKQDDEREEAEHAEEEAAAADEAEEAEEVKEVKEKPQRKQKEEPVVVAGPSAFSFLDKLVSAEPAAPPELPKAVIDTSKEVQQAALVQFVADLEQRGHRLLLKDNKFLVSNASQLTEQDRQIIKDNRAALIMLAQPWEPEPEPPSHDGGGAGVSRPSDAEETSQPTESVTPADAPITYKTPEGPVSCYYGTPWLDHFQPPIGTGKGCMQCKLIDDVVAAEMMNDEHRENLAMLAAPMSGGIAEFLGGAGFTAHAVDPNWKPDEPPSLDGIDEIVLNFATSGLDWTRGARPGGVTVATLDGKMIRFLPWAFAGGNLSPEVVKQWLQREVRGKKITNAHTSFDMHMSRVLGVDLEEQGCTFSDIQHTAALIDDHRRQFAIDVLAKDYLPGRPVVPRLDESHHLDYHASEAAARERYTVELVGKLREVLYPVIDKEGLGRVQALEDAVIPVVVEMEKNGAKLDVERVEEYYNECNRRHDKLLMEIAEEVGFGFDHTTKSWHRLFERLGLVPMDSYAEELISQVNHPIVQKGYLASQLASLNSKTFKAYRDQMDANGILHFEVNQLRGEDGGTVTGRFSIGYVQQVPNHDNHFAVFGEDLYPRRVYIAESGEVLEADAMQIEYRLGAHHANNAEILAAYARDPRMSFHKMTWEAMKRYKADMVYSHQKNFNFARQYGARSIKLAIMMKFITKEEGDEIRAAKRWNDPRLDTIHEIEDAYRKFMPEADELLDRASHLAKVECDKYCNQNDKLHRTFPHRGYVMTLLGRRSRFDSNNKTYIALNRVLQGTGADIMKQKLVELHRERKHTGLLLRLTVHDAVVGDARQKETKERVEEILNHQTFPELRVPILWECGTGATWADCKK